MRNGRPLLILGASGGCGKLLVRFAVERGHEVRALVRPSTSYEPPERVQVILGSVLDRKVLNRSVDGVHAVVSALGIKRKSSWNPWSSISSPKDLTARTAANLVEILPKHDVRRCVVISAAGVGDSADRLHPLIDWMIRHTNMAAQYADLHRMERILVVSRLDWMAVRPTTLTDGPLTNDVKLVDYYGLRTRISRADVAAWMLDALDQIEPFVNRTPMLATGGIRTDGMPTRMT